MEIKESVVDGISLITVSGRVDAVNADALEAFLVTAAEKAQSMIIDCSSLNYLSSAGMRALLIAQKLIGEKARGAIPKVKTEPRNFVLASINSPVLDILHLANIDKYFSIFATVAEAQTGLKRL